MAGGSAGRRVALSLAVVAGLALVAGVAATPRQHVARGCLWWTAATVDHVGAADRGCVRGYYLAGALAESGDGAGVRLQLRQPAGRTCPFRSGDAVAVRFHGVFDDGRTYIQVEECS